MRQPFGPPHLGIKKDSDNGKVVDPCQRLILTVGFLGPCSYQPMIHPGPAFASRAQLHRPGSSDTRRWRRNRPVLSAPSTAKRTSTLKHFAPISNPSNTETVVPSRLHSINGTCSCTHNALKPKGRWQLSHPSPDATHQLEHGHFQREYPPVLRVIEIMPTPLGIKGAPFTKSYSTEAVQTYF